MEIIDISWPITANSTTYKNKNNLIIGKDHVRMSVHTGTHIDAPAHFIENGETIDTINLSTLIGPCRVLDFTHIENAIGKADLVPLDIKRSERILLKTKNSMKQATDQFDQNFIYLDESGAIFLSEIGIGCIGIDYLGIERAQQNHPTHIAFLNKKIPIIEGLRLAHVSPGNYNLICMPISLHGLEAAPARAVLTSATAG